MTVAYLLKHDKFGSNFVLIKQNLPNSIILPPKMADLRPGRIAGERLIEFKRVFYPVLVSRSGRDIEVRFMIWIEV